MANQNQHDKDKVVYKKVGSGSFGYVISPGLSQSHNEDTSKQVTKLVFDGRGENRNVETMNALIVRTFIDPKSTFTPRLIKHGMIQRDKAYEIIKSIEKEKKMGKKFVTCDGSIPFITFQNGGENLDCFFMKKERTIYFEDLLPGFITLLQGVQKMHKNGFTHSDIKPLNMLVDDSQKIMLIDFGELVKHKNFKDTLHNCRIDHKYCYYPPEFIFLSLISMDDDKQKFQQRFREQYANVFGFMSKNDIDTLHESFLDLQKFLANDLIVLESLDYFTISIQDEKKKRKAQFTFKNYIIQKAYAHIETQLKHDDGVYPSYFDTFGLGISIRQIYIDAQRSQRIRHPTWCAKNIIPIFSGMCNPYLKGRSHIDEAVDSWKKSMDCYEHYLENIQNQSYASKPNSDGNKKRVCNGMTKRNVKCCRLARNGYDTCHVHN